MIPKIIHQIHYGKPPSADLQRYMKTVRDLHPGWKYMLWDEKTIPEIVLNPEYVKANYPTVTGLSNVARLWAIKLFGGIYLDTDCECVKPLDDLLDNAAFAALQNETEICSAVFGAKPNHPWINWQVGHMKKWQGSRKAWSVHLMSEAPGDFLTLLPTELFYSWLWTDPPEKRVAHPNAYVLHHWAGSWL